VGFALTKWLWDRFLLPVFSPPVSLIPPIPHTVTSYNGRYVISTTDSVVIRLKINKQNRKMLRKLPKVKYLLKEASAFPGARNNTARDLLPLTSNVGSKKDFDLNCFYI
jgi:hypothetical protein